MRIQLSEHFTYRKLLRFTLPSVIMMVCTSIYCVVDGVFVSNFVGSDAFAAVNLIMPFLMVLGAVGFMLGTGGSALVAYTLGAGSEKRANEIFSLLIYVLIGLGAVFTIGGIAFLTPVSRLLGADETMLPVCVSYGRIVLLGLIPYMLQNTFQSFLVTAERPQLGLYVTIAAGVTNIVLDALFVAVLQWGIPAMGHPQEVKKDTAGAACRVLFCACLPHDLADLGVAGSLRLVGVDVHGGDAAVVHAHDHIVEDQAALRAAEGDLDDLTVLDAHLLGVDVGDVDVPLGDDDALRQINLARGPDQLARAGAGQMAALADGRVDAERARVAAGELHLIGRAARAEDGDVLDRALRSDDGQSLMAGIDAGVGQVLARLQLVARAEQLLHGLLRQMDVARRCFNHEFHSKISFL